MDEQLYNVYVWKGRRKHARRIAVGVYFDEALMIMDEWRSMGYETHTVSMDCDAGIF